MAHGATSFPRPTAPSVFSSCLCCTQPDGQNHRLLIVLLFPSGVGVVSHVGTGRMRGSKRGRGWLRFPHWNRGGLKLAWCLARALPTVAPGQLPASQHLRSRPSFPWWLGCAPRLASLGAVGDGRTQGLESSLDCSVLICSGLTLHLLGLVLLLLSSHSGVPPFFSAWAVALVILIEWVS